MYIFDDYACVRVTPTVSGMCVATLNNGGIGATSFASFCRSAFACCAFLASRISMSVRYQSLRAISPR